MAANMGGTPGTISVIIPVYNTVDCLRKCLESVRQQTYKNLEIICVDDGSTDGSSQLLDEFAKVDERFVVIHQENKGVSTARNVGLLAAKGAYIGFIDADDWIDSEMYECLLNEMLNNNADMSSISFYQDTDEVSKPMENQLQPSIGVWSREELFLYVFKRDYYRGVSAYIWCKLFKREIVEVDGQCILFDSDITQCEDILWVAKVMSNAKSAVWIPKHMYHYYQRSTSASHGHNLKRMMTALIAYERVIELMEKNGIESVGWVKRFQGYWAFKLAEIALEQRNGMCLKECRRVMELRYDDYVHYNQEYPERIEAYSERMTIDAFGE